MGPGASVVMTAGALVIVAVGAAVGKHLSVGVGSDEHPNQE